MHLVSKNQLVQREKCRVLSVTEVIKAVPKMASCRLCLTTSGPLVVRGSFPFLWKWKGKRVTVQDGHLAGRRCVGERWHSVPVPASCCCSQQPSLGDQSAPVTVGARQDFTLCSNTVLSLR